MNAIIYWLRKRDLKLKLTHLSSPQRGGINIGSNVKMWQIHKHADFALKKIIMILGGRFINMPISRQFLMTDGQLKN